MAKKTTRKKTSAKKAKSRKKPVAKKKVKQKKPAAKKKTATRKASTRKSTTARTKKKPSSTSKATSRTRASAKKAASTRPGGRKTSTSKASVSKKRTSKSVGKRGATRAGTKSDHSASRTSRSMERFRSTSNDQFKAGQAAAARLAAAAGLQRLSSTSNGNTEDESYERLTKSPYPKRELTRFRKLLIEKRAQLAGDVNSMETEALTGGGSGSLSHLPQHMADQGSDTYDQTLALDLAASQRDLLREIDAAIERIDNDTFGICEMLGKKIGEERLEHTPWARFSIEAARRIERMGYPQ